MGARNRVGIGLSCRPTRLHMLTELIPWNRCLGSIKSLKIRALKELLSGKGEQKELYRWMCSFAGFHRIQSKMLLCKWTGRGGNEQRRVQKEKSSSSMGKWDLSQQQTILRAPGKTSRRLHYQSNYSCYIESWSENFIWKLSVQYGYLKIVT